MLGKLAALLIAVATPVAARPIDPVTAAEGDAIRAMAAFRPVGMAVAYIADGELQFAEGFGVRGLNDPARVDPDTVFGIASLTKAFTATALAMLVDDGKLAWDDRVVDRLPGFAMSDPWVTREMRVRDLLVHRSGLARGAGDLLTWPDGTATPGEVMAALRYLPLTQGFRSGFLYDNALYSVAGLLVARVSGMAWEDFVRARIFDPLGMASCSADPRRPRAANVAGRHASTGGGARLLAHAPAQPDPAGSIACSVRDMAKWAQFNLAGGVAPDGTRLLREAQMREILTGVTPMRPQGILRRLGATHFSLYGLGWTLADFHGALIAEHGGSAPGGTAQIVLAPERHAAAIVLVNDTVPATMLAWQLIDRALRGTAAADWIADVAGRPGPDAAAPAPAERAPPADAKPPAHPMPAYAGRYRDPWYGDLEVVWDGRMLMLHMTRSQLLRGPLIPFGGETFLARWPDRSLNADALVTFEADAGGRPVRIRLTPFAEDTDFSYDYQHLAPVRVPGPRADR
ncbi:CubicO group peptidase (beta-lactamase class C family) [Sphingomonas naasensis]|uniref:Serine hydrolase n=1 Tax=Sphingomonas naasensis TaxID=1344951 RepID=A0A4V3QWF8_9SPHN|nr:serine hydrolase [Sphingomonas naasensis]NIJ21917.1 CubicO group peptidase (beta-lactamase class C family) [Sphingomonas naasensis]TGX42392.1 serine hydrolase [Sphingomonas naasensis]